MQHERFSFCGHGNEELKSGERKRLFTFFFRETKRAYFDCIFVIMIRSKDEGADKCKNCTQMIV